MVEFVSKIIKKIMESSMKKQLLLLALINSFLFGSEIIVDKTTKLLDMRMIRDNTKEMVLDNKTGLMWQDDKVFVALKVITKPR